MMLNDCKHESKLRVYVNFQDLLHNCHKNDFVVVLVNTIDDAAIYCTYLRNYVKLPHC